MPHGTFIETEEDGTKTQFKWTQDPRRPKNRKGSEIWEYVRFDIGDFGGVFYLWKRPT